MKGVFFAAAAALCLAACNSEPGPEHTTAAEFGEMIYFPKALTSETDVSVQVPVSSKYGFGSVCVVYMIDDDQSNVKAAAIRSLTRDITSFTYLGQIPRQKAGTKVTFWVRAITAYNVSSYTFPQSYTVPPDEPDGGES